MKHDCNQVTACACKKFGPIQNGCDNFVTQDKEVAVEETDKQVAVEETDKQDKQSEQKKVCVHMIATKQKQKSM